MKKNKTGRALMRSLIVLIVMGLIAYGVFHSAWFQKKYIYPYPYREMVDDNARKNDLDPLLVLSIMKAESKFSAGAYSRAGAVGLMQLMPDSALWIADQMGIRIHSAADLEKPEVSIAIGSWYFESLLEENHGNKVLALAAYNAGRGNVAAWIKERHWSQDFDETERIPFTETREFVRRVLSNYREYKRLYEDEGAQ